MCVWEWDASLWLASFLLLGKVGNDMSLWDGYLDLDLHICVVANKTFFRKRAKKLHVKRRGLPIKLKLRCANLGNLTSRAHKRVSTLLSRRTQQWARGLLLLYMCGLLSQVATLDRHSEVYIARLVIQFQVHFVHICFLNKWIYMSSISYSLQSWKHVILHMNMHGVPRTNLTYKPW